MTNGNESIYYRPMEGEGYYATPEKLGLTKREYFAAMAMQGLLAASKWSTQEAAGLAVIAADKLINELNQTK